MEMHMRTLTPILALALLGCPTPPDGGTTGGNQPNAGGAPTPAPSIGATDGAQPVEKPDEADPDAKGGTYVVNEVHIDDSLDAAGQPTSEEAQKEIKAGDHVTFKGEIICPDCTSALVITVAPFVPPSDKAFEAGKAPAESDFKPPPYQVGGAGPFTMAVPKYAGQVVLEVLDDRDGNGRPSKGEKFTVLHEMGKLTAGKNMSDLKIVFSALPSAPGGASAAAGGPPPAGQGAPPPAGGPPPAAQ